MSDAVTSPETDPDAAASERRAQVLAEYGDAEPVMRACERETALHTALRAFVMVTDVNDMPKGSLLGWSEGTVVGMPWMVADAAAQAVVMPVSVREAWTEFSYWRKRASDRMAIDPGAPTPVWVLARRAVLAEVLDTMPGPTFEDVDARLAWLQHAMSAGGGGEQDQACLTRLRADIEVLAVSRQLAGCTASKPDALPASNPDISEAGARARRTNVEKRGAVLALLGQDLTDREIARRAGVSPQFVGNVRRAHADQDL